MRALLLIVLVGMSYVSDAAAQNFVDLSPTQSEAIVVGLDVALSLEIDFTDATVGGGVEIMYDATRLEFVSFSFSGDPNFGLTGPADDDPDQPLEIGAGWLVVSPPFGVTGIHTIGTLLFRPIASGSATVSTRESGLNPGPFYAASNATPLAVVFSGATVNVGSVAAVPTLDAYGRLIACALLLLLVIRVLSRREILGGSPRGVWE
jgi:hypothetical protein